MKTIVLFIYSILILLFCSCRKFIEIDPPIDRTTADIVFSSDETATASVVGLYSRMMTSRMSFASGAMTLYPALSADELYNTGPNIDYDPFTSNTLTSASFPVQSYMWVWAYNYIYHANACLERLDTATRVSAPVKQQLTGELKVLRAFCYFYLTQLFGDVPLSTGTDYKQNSALSRAPAQTVVQFITNELSEAQQLLIPAYPVTGRIRVNRHVATALLARVYLYQKKWTEAEAQTTSVINSGMYTLPTNLNSVFLAGGAEAIWQLAPVSATDNTFEASAFIPSGAARPAFALTESLWNSFEASDLRKASWIKSATVLGNTYHYPYKYKVKGLPPASEYYMILRLAEQYLIRAEARAQQEKIQDAQMDLNVIRNRAGLPNTTAGDKLTLLAAIEQERRVELAFEWGHRWFDLKRTGRVDAVLGLLKAGWQSSDALYPIPQYDLDRNPFLTQNPGY